MMSAPPDSASVLIVEDHEGNRALARAALEREGYRVRLADSGERALEELAQHADIGCVLLDVRLPGLDGFATCEQLRQMPGGADIPVVFLTGQRDVDTFDRALRAGGDDFLAKPVRPAELVVRVRSALTLRTVRSELRGHYELLKQQRDSLMRLQLQKERLMAFVVHDLKNPVNSLDLHAQLLLRDKSVSGDARESATQIRSEARLLTRMILNLLDLAKADEGKLEPDWARVDLGGLIRDLITELDVGARRRDVTLRANVAVQTMRADPELLRRAMTNLTENAIRHTRAGSTVTIGTEACAEGVLLRVRDEGPGVRAELKERIFEAFARADRETADVGGRGLGLTFCRTVAEAHGGHIRVEDAHPGAAFCLVVPQ